MAEDETVISGMADAQKWGMVLPISEDGPSGGFLALRSLYEKIRSATPEEREQLMREAAEKRATIRAATPVEDDIVVGLGRNFGWSPEYIRHLAQPYCECDYDTDGAWDYCRHAVDLGLDR